MRKIAINSLVTMLIVLTGSIVSAQTDWVKYENNPVLVQGPDESWDDVGLWAPVVILDGSTFKMWYGGDPGGGRFRIGYAESSDGTTWTKHVSNPVIDVGPSGAWDDTAVLPGPVIFDGSSYKMWYSGMDFSSWRTGYATSSDGITWTKHASNPVMDLGPNGEFDDFWALIRAVIFNGSDYQGWYFGLSQGKIGTGYVTSPDGIVWTKHASNPVLDVGDVFAFDGDVAGVSSVIFNGSIYEMWYWAAKSTIEQVGYATSTDGIAWDKSDQSPVLPNGPFGSWDGTAAAQPTVLWDGTSYHLWYQGDNPSPDQEPQIGYATPGSITGIADEEGVPEKYELSQNYPNPFNPETVIRYSIPNAEKVSLVLYNLIGEEVAHLVDERKPAGSYTVEWNASNFASGIYFYRLQAGDFVRTRKMVLLK